MLKYKVFRLFVIQDNPWIGATKTPIAVTLIHWWSFLLQSGATIAPSHQCYQINWCLHQLSFSEKWWEPYADDTSNVNRLHKIHKAQKAPHKHTLVSYQVILESKVMSDQTPIRNPGELAACQLSLSSSNKHSSHFACIQQQYRHSRSCWHQHTRHKWHDLC